MTVVVALLCGVLGLAVGSFLNVVIYRVPRAESVVRPRSHCPHCGLDISARDNIPLLSWVLLRGRCRGCGDRISARYPLVELGTAVLFGGMGARFGLIPVLPAFLYLAALAATLTMIDLDHKRLPNAIVLPSYGVVPLLLAVGLLGGARPGDLLRALFGAAALFAVYFALAFAYPAGMGFGDVKLAGVLGWYLGWLGWASWAVGLVVGFLSGGLVGVALLATGRAGRKTAIPFGPFMLFGVLVAVFFGPRVAHVWLRV